MLQCYFDSRLCSKHNNKSTLTQKLLVYIQKKLINMNIKNLTSTQGRAQHSLHEGWNLNFIGEGTALIHCMTETLQCAVLKTVSCWRHSITQTKMLRKTACCWVELIAMHCRSWMLRKLPMLQGLCAGETNLCWKICQAEHIWTRNESPCFLQCVCGVHYCQSSTLCLLLRAQLNFFRASNEGKFEVEGQ